MNRREVAAVITYVGRLDPRLIRTNAGEARDQLNTWHELLDDVPMTTDLGWDVRETSRKRIVSSQYPILPADVARDWYAHRRDRLARHTDPTPMADPDNPKAWRAELLAARDAVAAGQAAPSAHRGITAGRHRPGLKDQPTAVNDSYIPPAVRAELAPYRPARAAREAAIAAGGPDVLGVPCEWCRAVEGEPCRRRRISLDGAARGNAPRTTAHPCRIDRALAARSQASAA
ncbi:zinc finger domain-containing protein [Streptomyces sp. NPDC001219]